MIENISWKGKALASIIQAEFHSDKTTFLTPSEYNLQVGFVVYPAGGEVARHVHSRVERHIVGTSEVIFVRAGKCEVDIYNDEYVLVATRQLKIGDVLLMVSGGHGFRMLEDTVLMEVKQGPYGGIEEKERF